MMGKKLGMRWMLACALAAAMALGGMVTTLAAPTVAEAYPTNAEWPIQSKDKLSYDKQYQPVTLAGGKDYVFAGSVDIYYYKVEGGTAEKPTRLYFRSDSYLGGPLTDKRDIRYSQHPLFVLTGGYVEFIGDSGASTEVRCDGKAFLSDSADYDRHGGVDKPNTGKSLDLTARDLKLVSRTGANGDSDRAILLYGTMGKGETVAFTNVNVSNWDCAHNAAGQYGNVVSDYVASPAPVTIRGCNVAVDATFTNCTFEDNCDDCVGALSVVGRAKRPKVTLNNCTFKNNYQTMIACDKLKIESVESGHVHSGNIGVKNADVTLNGCSIVSEPYAAPSWRHCPSAYMDYGCDMHMTSALAVAKDASCTISDTAIDDSYTRASTDKYGKPYSIQDAKRGTVYALGSVTLAGNTKITSTVAKGLDASGVGSYGKIRIDKSFTGDAVLSVDDTKFDSSTDPRGYYYAYVNLGTSDLSREDLSSRLKLANGDLTYEVTDGKVKVIHRKHEHAWNYSVNADGYSIAAKCAGQYEASHCNYSRDGDTISLMSSKSGDLSFTYNGKAHDAVLDTTKPSQKDNAVSQGKVKITAARFYRCADENDARGIEMEGSQPTDAGYYRVVATVAVEGQDDVTLERRFRIAPASLAEKNMCKIEVIGYDKLRDNVRFKNGDVRDDVPSYKWTGEEITPRIKVTYKLADEWIELKEGVDFERLAWGESVSEKDPGSYRSQIWGLGNYVYGPFFYWTIYGTQFQNVQAEGYDGAYDGEYHTPSVTVDDAPDDMKIEYSADDGSTWSTSKPAYKNVARDSSGAVTAKNVRYRITASDYVPVEGEVTVKIVPADQESPQGLKATAPTGHGLADGSIGDVDGAYEWKLASADGGYRTVTKGETSIKGLAAGSYLVRLKADRNHNASDDATVEVEDGPKKADGTGWKHDDAEHWHACTCGKEDIDRAEHDFEWVTDRKPTATEPGSKHQRCKTCGYERAAVEIPAYGVKGYSGTYDGKTHGVAVDAETIASIEFREKGADAWSDASPLITDAGTMTVEFRATLKSGDVCEGEVTLEVKPRAVTVAAEDASKTYGEADPELGFKVTEGTLVEGESLTGISVTREEGEDVRKGGYALNATAEEGTNPNYALTFKAGTFTIKPKTLGVSWSNTEFVYDGESHVPTATATGAIDGESVALTVKGAAKKAGTHTATVTGIEGDKAGDYALPKNGLTCDFTIKKAPQGAPAVQAEAETVSGRHDGKITGVDASMEWRAEDATAYAAVGDGTTELTDLAPGTYRVRYAAGENHDASADTEVAVAAGPKLKVTLPDKQEGYTLKANATELDWHQGFTLTFALSDGYYRTDAFAVKVNGDTVELAEDGTATVSGLEKDATVTVEGLARHEAVSDEWHSDENGHWHDCTCGGKIDEAAHAFKWVIDKKPTATEPGSKHEECTVCGYAREAVEIPAASVGGYSGEYDGAWHGPDTSNVPEGTMVWYSYDDGESWTTGEPGRKDVGTEEFIYKVTVDGVSVEGKASIAIAPRAVTLKAADVSKVYGEADPALSYTVTAGSLVEGESLDGITVAREKGEAVREGGYAIAVTQKKGANPNYDVTLMPGVFAISRRPLTVTWGATDFVYDGAAHVPTAALGNVLKGDKVETTVEGAQTAATRADETYTATVTGLTGDDAGNYALPSEGLTRTFTIKNAPQDAPKVQAQAETVSGKRDGKITGVDTTMEWRAKDAAAYQAVSDDAKELTGLAPGTYHVRYRAKENHDASPDTEVTVAAGRKLVVALPAEQAGYTLTSSSTELDWHGSATLAIKIDGAYFAGKDYAVKVDGKKVDFSANGTYELKDVEADVNVTVEGVLKHEPDGAGWKSDATSHWHVCRCGAVIDKADHDFEWVTDTPATVESEGSRHQECKICGARGKDGKIDILAPADGGNGGGAGAPTGGNGGAAKPSASKGNTAKKAADAAGRAGADKSTAAMPHVGDTAFAVAAAVLVMGVAAVTAAWVVRRR